VLLPTWRLRRPLPRAARPACGLAQAREAHQCRRLLLARRRLARAARARLRHRLLRQGRPRRALAPARGGAQARPPRARRRARPLLLPRRGAGLPVLPSERSAALPDPHRLHAEPAAPARLPGGEGAARALRGALAHLWSLRQLPREHVLHEAEAARREEPDRRARGGGGAAARGQADELSGPPADLPEPPAQPQRVPAALRGDGARAPARALRRAPW